MKIRDFSVYERAYLVDKKGVKETRVTSIGTKYVYTVDDRYGKGFYKRKEDEPFLVENIDWGDPRILFQTRVSAEEYLEKENLAVKIFSSLKLHNLQEMTLEQLRIISKALEDNSEAL